MRKSEVLEERPKAIPGTPPINQRQDSCCGLGGLTFGRLRGGGNLKPDGFVYRGVLSGRLKIVSEGKNTPAKR